MVGEILPNETESIFFFACVVSIQANRNQRLIYFSLTFFSILCNDLFYASFQRPMLIHEHIERVRTSYCFSPFRITNHCNLESVDSGRLSRGQKQNMSRTEIEPKSLEEAGYQFDQSKESETNSVEISIDYVI